MSGCKWFEGIPFPDVGYDLEILREIVDNFVMKDEDTVILTYPKSGTNWLIEIICLILTMGDSKWIQSVPIWERSPWIESAIGNPLVNKQKNPRLFTSHLPIHLFPKSFFTSKAKVIYTIRNPRDILVSGYFFWNKTYLMKKSKSFEEYFEWFFKGNVPYGSWFEHTRGWMSMRNRENFHLLSYEELKNDTRGTIEKICQFLGKKLEPEQLDLVLKNSTFQAMRENEISNYGSLPPEISDGILPIMRKGTTGDWKNHFTATQAEAFDKAFQEKMAGFPPGLFPWE